MIVETDEKNKSIKDFKVVENTAKDQVGGAGVSSGELVAKQNVDAIITVNVGPRAFSVFEQFGIKMYKGDGKIKDVIQKFLDKKLKEMNDATGPQHEGMK